MTVGFYCQRVISGILTSDWFLGNKILGEAGNLAGLPSKFVRIMFEAEGMRVHGLKMDLLSLWSQGLRGERHSTAAKPECGEYLFFQQKCVQQRKSSPRVPQGSYSHQNITDHTPLQNTAVKRGQ